LNKFHLIFLFFRFVGAYLLLVGTIVYVTKYERQIVLRLIYLL